MLRPIVSTLLLTLSLTACGREAPPATASTAGDAPSKTSAQPAAPAQTSESQQATAAQESVSEATPEERSDASLERLVALPPEQQLPNGRWKAGVNYQPLMPPMPTNVGAGQVEVLEMFAYGCPHCYALEPYIASWLKNKPAYVKFERIPAWGREEARLYYTIEALGRPDLHLKVFQTIHPQPGVRRHDLLFAKDDDAGTLELQRKFAMANGVGAAEFDKALKSFSMETNLKRANDLLRRYNDHFEVGNVPSIVVNGKYVTDVGRAGGHGALLELINDLAASEKRR